MRKTLAAAAVLLLMPLALLLAADAALRGTEEAVEIRETVLSGDRSAARGVDLTFHVQSEGHLFWDTAVSLGTETLLPETVFAFSQWERREEEPFVPWAEISISGTNYGISSSGGISIFSLVMETCFAGASITSGIEGRNAGVSSMRVDA